MKARYSKLGKLLRTAITWYLLLYLPLGMLCYARAFLSFANHRAIGVPYEILTIYEAPPEPRLHWVPFRTPWQMHPGSMRGPTRAVPVDQPLRGPTSAVPFDEPHPAFVALRVALWGGSTEERIEYLSPFIIEEVPAQLRDRAAAPMPTITFLGEEEREWISNIEERWCAGERQMVKSTAALNRSLTRIYGKENIWYVFAASTLVELELQAHPQVAEAILQAPYRPGGRLAVPPGTFSQARDPRSDPRIMTALDDLVAKASLWQRGEQSRAVLWQSIRQIDFRYAGVRVLHDNFIIILLWFTFFYLPTLPLYALFFFPLLVVPHWLAVPVALVFPLVLAAWWVSRWRQLAKTPRIWLSFLLVMHLLLYLFVSPV